MMPPVLKTTPQQASLDRLTTSEYDVGNVVPSLTPVVLVLVVEELLVPWIQRALVGGVGALLALPCHGAEAQSMAE